MKKTLKFLLPVLTAAAVFLSGCSLPTSGENTTVSVDETGAVTETIAEDTDGSYTESELKEYIENSIKNYDSSDSLAVSCDSVSVSSAVTKIVMKYKTVSDYSKFNQVPAFLGTISEAQEAGYTTDQNYVDPDGAAGSREEISERSKEWKIFIVSEPVLVRVPDKILYTTPNVTVTGRLTARVDSVIDDSADADGQEAVSGNSASENVSSESVREESSGTGTGDQSGSRNAGTTRSESVSSGSSEEVLSSSAKAVAEAQSARRQEVIDKYTTYADTYAYIIYK